MGKVFHSPLLPLVAFALFVSVLLSSYVLIGAAPSAALDVMVAFLWAILLAWWIVRDARRHDLVPCCDFGLFCYMFLPLSVPCYCLWSRGWRGSGTLALVAIIWLAPYVVANLVWWLRYG